MQYFDFSAPGPRHAASTTLAARFVVDPLGQSPASSVESDDGRWLDSVETPAQRFALRAPDLARRLGLIAVERAVRRYQPKRMA